MALYRPPWPFPSITHKNALRSVFSGTTCHVFPLDSGLLVYIQLAHHKKVSEDVPDLEKWVDLGPMLKNRSRMTLVAHFGMRK